MALTSEKVLSEKVGMAVAEPMKQEVKVKFFDLLKYSSGQEIEAALGENHLFDVAGVYSVIGALISKQSQGEEGALLTTGSYNLFYTEKFVLSVHWRSGDGGWCVFCWGRDWGWHDGTRVFSPETDA